MAKHLLILAAMLCAGAANADNSKANNPPVVDPDGFERYATLLHHQPWLPALELSLTDTRDQVISRRVFLPEEWPDAPEVLPAQGSLTVSFRLSLSVGEATPMAGYRALVFYP